MNNKLHWKILSSEYLHQHVYFTARRDRCEKQDGTIIENYFVVELPPSACAVALTASNEVVLIKQYRHPIEQVIYEIPGGFIDAGEDIAEGIQRELLEETGYRFSEVLHLGRVAANPGILNNYTELFLLKGGQSIASQQLDTNEEIEIELVSLPTLTAMLLEGKIVQSLHASCIFYALIKLGVLQAKPDNFGEK
jgi:ADP-ribose pyrophosphatase